MHIDYLTNKIDKIIYNYKPYFNVNKLKLIFFILIKFIYIQIQKTFIESIIYIKRYK